MVCEKYVFFLDFQLREDDNNESNETNLIGRNWRNV